MSNRSAPASRFLVMLEAFIAASFIACAPEPTTPSDTDLGGTWRSNARLFTLSGMRMDLVQEPRGIVSGEWSARGEGGGGGCPPATPCDASGLIIGRNTIAQVEIELLGAGKFEGGLIDDSTLRGVFVITTSYDTITFVRQAQ